MGPNKHSALERLQLPSLGNGIKKLYVARTVHFGMKLYNDQRNAQDFNLFIYSHPPLPSRYND
jgi:hypothetical protein